MNTKKAAAIQAIRIIEDTAKRAHNDYNEKHKQFMAVAAKDPARAVEWAKDVIVAQVKYEQIDKLRARVQEVKDDDALTIDVVKSIVEEWVADVQKPLLENWLSDGSDPLTNAVASSKRAALAQLLRLEVPLIKEAMEHFSEEADEGR